MNVVWKILQIYQNKNFNDWKKFRGFVDGWFNLYEKSKGVQFQSNKRVVVDFLKVNS